MSCSCELSCSTQCPSRRVSWWLWGHRSLGAAGWPHHSVIPGRASGMNPTGRKSRHVFDSITSPVEKNVEMVDACGCGGSGMEWQLPGFRRRRSLVQPVTTSVDGVMGHHHGWARAIPWGITLSVAHSRWVLFVYLFFYYNYSCKSYRQVLKWGLYWDLDELCSFSVLLNLCGGAVLAFAGASAMMTTPLNVKGGYSARFKNCQIVIWYS